MSDPKKVFIFAPADETGESHQLLETNGCELTLGDASWSTPQGNSEDQMAKMAEGAVALAGTSIRSSPITRKIMEAAPDLRIVAKYTIGVDDVDVDAATEMGILVTHAPTESNWGGVAEGTMAIMLAILKRLRERDEQVKAGGWRDESHQGTFLGRRGDGYEGITIGIVGLGRIGTRLSDYLRPWRVRLIGNDPYVPLEHFEECGVQPVDLETLLKESDVATFHVVMTGETRNMVGARELAMMKPSAVLINTSRGGVVNEAALIDALESGHIRAAGIDVFEQEPLPSDSKLKKLGDKVLLSPHMVSSNSGTGGLRPGIKWATDSVLAALRGEVPDNVYNKEVIPAWIKRFGRRG
ncbi:MAG: NAD(P)-dependent oxidoreductase [Chloroflexi bacterium]|nr:NAD(P)-dependent oxidoreductase [Chloroflexota bacterium]